MTTEEKAQAYDEALERARKQKYDYQKELDKTDKNSQLAGILRAGISAIELVFPELAENEDEKIRKEINTLYSDIDTCISELLKARTDKDSETEGKALFKMEGLMVATLQDLSCIEDYLEKLNDFQFDYPGLYFYDGKKLHFQGNPAMEENPYDFAMSQQEKPIDPFDTKLFQDGVKEGRRLEREDMKKEQQSAENISQLIVKGKGVYKICPHCKSRMIRDDSKIYTSMPPQYGYNCPKCGTIGFDTVMYDSPEIEEQEPAECIPDSIKFDEGFKAGREVGFREGVESVKPAEWNEEDEQWLECIIKDYEDSLTKDKDHAAVIKIKIDFLKSLHLQPHTVSIKDATNFGNLEYERGVKDGIQSEKSRHWKPIEEQMKALYCALNDAISLYSDKVSPLHEEISRAHFDALESLYNDLKKL